VATDGQPNGGQRVCASSLLLLAGLSFKSKLLSSVLVWRENNDHHHVALMSREPRPLSIKANAWGWLPVGREGRNV